jgi:hypothetical protein
MRVAIVEWPTFSRLSVVCLTARGIDLSRSSILAICSSNSRSRCRISSFGRISKGTLCFWARSVRLSASCVSYSSFGTMIAGRRISTSDGMPVRRSDSEARWRTISSRRTARGEQVLLDAVDLGQQGRPLHVDVVPSELVDVPDVDVRGLVPRLLGALDLVPVPVDERLDRELVPVALDEGVHQRRRDRARASPATSRCRRPGSRSSRARS